MTKKYDVEFKKNQFMLICREQATYNSKKGYGIAKSILFGWGKNIAKNVNTLPNQNQIMHMQSNSITLIKKFQNWRK